MKIQTEVFGEIEVSENQQVFFAEGLSNIEAVRDYLLLPIGDDELLCCLQAKNHPGISFFLIDPLVVSPKFKLETTVAELATIGFSDGVLSDDALVLCPFLMNDKAGTIKVNLQAPVVINRKTRQGRQVKNSCMEQSSEEIKLPKQT